MLVINEEETNNSKLQSVGLLGEEEADNFLKIAGNVFKEGCAEFLVLEAHSVEDLKFRFPLLRA